MYFPRRSLWLVFQKTYIQALNHSHTHTVICKRTRGSWEVLDGGKGSGGNGVNCIKFSENQKKKKLYFFKSSRIKADLSQPCILDMSFNVYKYSLYSVKWVWCGLGLTYRTMQTRLLDEPWAVAQRCCYHPNQRMESSFFPLIDGSIKRFIHGYCFTGKYRKDLEQWGEQFKHVVYVNIDIYSHVDIFNIDIYSHNHW